MFFVPWLPLCDNNQVPGPETVLADSVPDARQGTQPTKTIKICRATTRAGAARRPLAKLWGRSALSPRRRNQTITINGWRITHGLFQVLSCRSHQQVFSPSPQRCERHEDESRHGSLPQGCPCWRRLGTSRLGLSPPGTGCGTAIATIKVPLAAASTLQSRHHHW